MENRKYFGLWHWKGLYGKDLPRVSCNTLTYGRPQLLNEAVACFLNQDYPGEAELIILNDHPDILIDETLDFKLEQNKSIKVINSKERFKSIGEKRNECIKLSTGEIIVPWDDDDIYMSHRISFQISRMTNHHFQHCNSLIQKSNDIYKLVTKSGAHGLDAFSKAIWDYVQYYPALQSGQDQGFLGKIKNIGFYNRIDIMPSDVYYIYRFAGSSSYHLSAYGWDKGLQESETYVNNKIEKGTYKIVPQLRKDYFIEAFISILNAK